MFKINLKATSTVEDNDSIATCGGFKIEIFEKEYGINLYEDELPGPGFARKSGKGNYLFGTSYISDDKEDIKELIE